MTLLTGRGFIELRDGRTEGHQARHACSRGSTARAICWSPSACATKPGPVWIPQSWRRCCRRWCSSRGATRRGRLASIEFDYPRFAGRARPHAAPVGRHSRRRTAPPPFGQPRAGPRLRRGDPPLGDHRRLVVGAGRIRHRGERISAVRRGFRAVVPPGPRPARPGPKRRSDARLADDRETCDRRHSARRRGS